MSNNCDDRRTRYITLHTQALRIAVGAGRDYRYFGHNLHCYSYYLHKVVRRARPHCVTSAALRIIPCSTFGVCATGGMSIAAICRRESTIVATTLGSERICPSESPHNPPSKKKADYRPLHSFFFSSTYIILVFVTNTLKSIVLNLDVGNIIIFFMNAIIF